MKEILANNTSVFLSEVYVSDIRHLHECFNAWQGQVPGTPAIADLGIPFLQFRERGAVLGFASIIPGSDDQTTFAMYWSPAVPAAYTKEAMLHRVQSVFDIHWLPEYADVAMLKAGIGTLLQWLNAGQN